jgi:hypothetical protein
VAENTGRNEGGSIGKRIGVVTQIATLTNRFIDQFSCGGVFMIASLPIDRDIYFQSIGTLFCVLGASVGHRAGVSSASRLVVYQDCFGNLTFKRAKQTWTVTEPLPICAPDLNRSNFTGV